MSKIKILGENTHLHSWIIVFSLLSHLKIHGLGLKYGIYEDYGNYTCGGYPGVYGNEELDAQTLADWEADYIKLDGCYMDPDKMDEGKSKRGLFGMLQHIQYI